MPGLPMTSPQYKMYEDKTIGGGPFRQAPCKSIRDNTVHHTARKKSQSATLCCLACREVVEVGGPESCLICNACAHSQRH